MNWLSNKWDNLFVKQWNVGLSRLSIRELLEKGSLDVPFTWLPEPEHNRFYADPFIFRNKSGKLHVVYEDFHYYEQYGKISIAQLDDQFRPVSSNTLLNTKTHLSYPYVIHDQGKTFIMPENSKEGEVIYYEFDEKNQSLHNPETMFRRLPLLDTTILFHQNRYWLFATHRGPNSNKDLYIYHAPHWTGPYTEHACNPVKQDLSNSRPAGNFIHYNGDIYRPTQNCKEYYGKSIVLNKITKLTEHDFAEEPVAELTPPKGSKFNFAIHTINFSDDVIVIDGLRRVFAPWQQVKNYWRRKTLRMANRSLATGLLTMALEDPAMLLI
jgi:hypothetical protein